MRHTAGRLNRTWLTIIGVVLLAGGALAAAIGLGLLEGLAVAGVQAPGRDQPILSLTSEGSTLAAVLIVAGAVLGLLAVLWLLAQVPRKHGASTLKLQDPDKRGLTVLRPTLLEQAISDRVEMLDDVTAARAVIRGAARTPDVTLRVTMASQADIPAIVAGVERRVVDDLRRTLGEAPASVAIEVDVRGEPKKSSSVTLGQARAHA